MKLDPNSIKANIVKEGRNRKNEYSSPPKVKKETYLSPNEKENELSIEKYEHALNKNKSKRIFYNPPPKWFLCLLFFNHNSKNIIISFPIIYTLPYQQIQINGKIKNTKILHNIKRIN